MVELVLEWSLFKFVFLITGIDLQRGKFLSPNEINENKTFPAHTSLSNYRSILQFLSEQNSELTTLTASLCYARSPLNHTPVYALLWPLHLYSE